MFLVVSGMLTVFDIAMITFHGGVASPCAVLQYYAFIPVCPLDVSLVEANIILMNNDMLKLHKI